MTINNIQRRERVTQPWMQSYFYIRLVTKSVIIIIISFFSTLLYTIYGDWMQNPISLLQFRQNADYLSIISSFFLYFGISQQGKNVATEYIMDIKRVVWNTKKVIRFLELKTWKNWKWRLKKENMKKTWNFPNYKREQKLQSLKI